MRSRFFFFQAEDGIRDATVTGVQTCALPISGPPPLREERENCSCARVWWLYEDCEQPGCRFREHSQFDSSISEGFFGGDSSNRLGILDEFVNFGVEVQRSNARNP